MWVPNRTLDLTSCELPLGVTFCVRERSCVGPPGRAIWRGAVLRAVILAPRANPRSYLDIGRRLALRSLAVQARDVVADAQFAEPVQ